MPRVKELDFSDPDYSSLESFDDEDYGDCPYCGASYDSTDETCDCERAIREDD